jgi:U6 snRNA-associated Sm-like protein LSm8
MDSLQPLVGKVVVVVTLEGRCLVGLLKGLDSVGNLVLENASERTFHLDKGMQLEPMGLYLVRGDSLCVVRARARAAHAPAPSFWPTCALPPHARTTHTHAPLAPPRSGLLGELDAELDAAVDWDAVRGEPPGGIVLSSVAGQ